MTGRRRRIVLLGIGNVLVAFSLLGVLLLVVGSRGGSSDQPSRQTSSADDAASADMTGHPPTASPTAVVESATAAPTPDLALTPTAIPFHTLLDEHFADNRMTWPDNPQGTAWLADGGYHFAARQPGQFVAVGAPLPEPISDVVVTATFRKVGGPPGGGYGVIVREQGPGPRDGINQSGSFYVLEVGEQGMVGIWRRDGDRWVDLLPWTPSPAARPGNAPNELAVHAIGQRLIFVVNGAEVASQVDAVLARGGVGVFVGGDLNEVVLERLVVQVPTSAGEPPAPSAGRPDSAGGASPVAGASPAPASPTATPATPLSITKVTIPRIALDAEVVPARLVDNAGGVTWEVPPFRVGHAEHTAGAGERGNAVLLGHVTSQSVGNVFQELDRVEVGDVLEVSSESRTFEYRVVQVHRVARTDVSVVQPTDSAAVTLITCTGVWLPGIRDYAERLVVRGEHVGG